MEVFCQFELVISIISVGLLNTKGDMQALSSFSMNCFDHLIAHTAADKSSNGFNPSLGLVLRIRLPGTLTDADSAQTCQTSISAAVNPLNRKLLVLALASQNTWNAPSEIIPTCDLRNDTVRMYDILSRVVS